MDYQSLLGVARSQGKLNSIRTQLKKMRGFISNGHGSNKKLIESYLGVSSNKVISYNDKIELLGDDFVMMGGWCVMRTADVKNLKNGYICDLETGELVELKSLDQFIIWLGASISIDQVTESLIPYNGEKYIGISEVELWYRRLVRVLEKVLDIQLSQNQKTKLKDTIKTVEKRRAALSQKYLETVLNKPIKLTRLVDEDMFDEILAARNKLLSDIGLSFEDLQAPTLLRYKRTDPKKYKQDVEELKNYINDYSISWFFFSGAYFDLLKNKGLISAKKGLLGSPRSFAGINDIESQKLFFDKLTENNNSYLNPNGINKDVGIVVFDEISTYRFNPLKLHKNMGEIPNNHNYKQIIKKLYTNTNKRSVILKDNPVFEFAFNYYPYNNVLKLLEEMLSLQNSYKEFKKSVDANSTNRQQIIETNRNNYETKISAISDKIIDEFAIYFSNLFTS